MPSEPRADAESRAADDGESEAPSTDHDAPAATAGDDTTLAYDLDTYERLLERFLEAGYEFVGFDGAVENGQVALRHDVDLSVERALAMAELEASLGVRSTYCFLVTAPAYDLLTPTNRRRLREIAELGHDLGLHFDPHHYWDGQPDAEELRERVVADRECLAAVADEPVAAVSIHVPPEWALDADFEGFENTYRPAYFSEIAYVSDSSGKWRDAAPFQDGLPDALQLLVHPGLWHETDREVAAVVDDVRRRRVQRLESYLGPIGE